MRLTYNGGKVRYGSALLTGPAAADAPVGPVGPGGRVLLELPGGRVAHARVTGSESWPTTGGGGALTPNTRLFFVVTNTGPDGIGD